MTLEEWSADWFSFHVERVLAPRTRLHYRELWQRHVAPALGELRLEQLTPERCERFAAEFAAAGAGPATVRKVLALLQGCLALAIRWGRLPANPVAGVPRPAAARERFVRPLAPAAVEALRAQLIAGGRAADAALVCLMAYAGLRPQEALALQAGDVGARLILVERALVSGTAQPTKTRRKRTVRLLAPLAEDLRPLLAARAAEEPLFSLHGRLWSDAAYRNWRRRVFRPAAAGVGLAGLRPYDLRHSFCSLLLAGGTNPVEVAADAGHSLETLYSTYAHVIRELAGAPPLDAEALIRAARGQAGRA